MKLLCVNGSPRKNGNTSIMLKRVSKPLAQAGVEIDELYLEGMDLQPCVACGVCAQKKDGKCYGRKDDGNEIIERTRAVDVIILGSPVYFGSLTGQIKAYLDRVGYVSYVTDKFLRRKIGAAVVPARRSGKLLTFAELNMWFFINGMIMTGSRYWNVGIGRLEGEIEQDTEAMDTLDELAENILWLLEKIRQ